MTKVSIVIPNWNGVEKIKKNLPRVLEVAKQNNINEVIVSDDASTDGSVEIIKQQFPEVILLTSDKTKNLGFASNVNKGVGVAEGEIIFLLNSDAVPDINFLTSAFRHFDDPKVFSVGCNAGGYWATAKFENGFFWTGQGSPEQGDINKPHQTLWASGGSGFFRKSIWDELGGLDTLFDPFYHEDTDLGYRATKRGYINIWEPDSKVDHYQEKGVIEINFSKQEVAKTAQRNQLILTWKNITSARLLSDHKKALLKMVVTHPKYGLTFLAAIKYLPEILTKRRIEQKAAKLTDEEVFSIFAGS